MIRKSKSYNILLVIAIVYSSLISCSNSKDDTVGTLADLDNTPQRRVLPKPKTTSEEEKKRSQEQVRQAYEKYVATASTHDSSRQKALTRLAQLELELSSSMSEENQTPSHSPAANASLKRTIDLLETTLRDYPNAKGNDKVMYQLAQAYDRAGQYQQSMITLKTLARRFPQSLYYAEAQFRLGESAFARGDYIMAEDAYTEVVLTPGSEKFYEKSLFKRGWTRYKQEFFVEAADDYVAAMEFHRFREYEQLNDSEKSQFGEYLRAIALAFSYLQGQTSIAEYFAQHGEFKYVYETYDAVAAIYLKQERYSDAAEVLEEYAQRYPNTKTTPLAELAIITAWQQGGFTSNLYQSIERFYNNYHPSARFWTTIQDEAIYKTTSESLRTYITQISAHFHSRYRDKGKSSDYQQAAMWYERYLTHYTAYANKDNIYSLYGELLLDGKQERDALKYFSLAAYDGDIILDKKAAYSTIVISSTLIDTAKDAATQQLWLEQHLGYAQRFVDLYPKDLRSQAIATSAAERAFNAKFYTRAIDLANFIPDAANEKIRFNANNIKARAFLELEQYADAEATYLELLESKVSDKKGQNAVKNSLALAIYRQAEQARELQQTDLALRHFTRIAGLIPDSALAPTGLYDAIALSMASKQWNQAIGIINEFKTRYPRHERIADVSKKLSVAYLNSDQKGKAAQEFERISKFEDKLEIKMASLWQAAELYESRNDLEGAIRTYREFANTYEQPYDQNMEAMYKLTSLYIKARDPQKSYFWQNKILRADKKATKRVKTERTTFIASSTSLALARQKRAEFSRRTLVEPLAQNLKLKKTAMQEAVKLFGLASSYGIEEITTESTTTIGDIYFDFSKSLMSSERPKSLSPDELEQYEILLEDQAFPFEEKAIEFYEANMARTQDNTFDQWISQSLAQLEKLFPVRYQRKGKIDVLP